MKKIFTVLLTALLFNGLITDAQIKPSDTQISLKIKEEFRRQKGVDPAAFEVKTVNGIATITGSVENLLAGERAVLVAKSVDSVRAVVDRITYRFLPRPDNEVHKDIIRALAVNPAITSYSFDISVLNDTATISGNVFSWTEHLLAENLAKSVQGLQKVNNRLNYIYKSKRSDEEILQEINQNMIWNVFVNDQALNIRVEKGKVTLRGFVGTQDEKKQVVYLAWINGVNEVVYDNLKVDTSAKNRNLRENIHIKRSNEEITKILKDIFAAYPQKLLFNSDIKYTVNNGVVTFTGTVNTEETSILAEKDARNIPGVWWVRNQLSVIARKKPNDADIIKSITSSVSKSKYLEGKSLSFTSDSGKVTVSGVVDAFYQKLEAEDIVIRTAGVKSVENKIEIKNTPIVNPAEAQGNLEANIDLKIRENILKKMEFAPFIPSTTGIDVKVRDKMVTLSGKVDSFNTKMMIANIALEGGAIRVFNNLEIK